jgi:hypothetical protein
MIRLIIAALILIMITNYCNGRHYRRVLAKGEGCVDDICGDLCIYDNENILVNGTKTFYRPTKSTCYQVTCEEDFHVTFEL